MEEIYPLECRGKSGDTSIILYVVNRKNYKYLVDFSCEKLFIRL